MSRLSHLEIDPFETANTSWNSFKSVVLDTAKAISEDVTSVGPKSDWMSVNTWKAVEERKALKTQGLSSNEDREQYSQLNTRVQRLCREDRNNFIDLVCEDIERHAYSAHTKDMFQKVKFLAREFKPKSWSIEDDKGKPITDRELVLERIVRLTVVTTLSHEESTEKKMSSSGLLWLLRLRLRKASVRERIQSALQDNWRRLIQPRPGSFQSRPRNRSFSSERPRHKRRGSVTSLSSLQLPLESDPEPQSRLDHIATIHTAHSLSKMAHISLKISLDGGKVVKTIQFDPSTTVYDACRVIREKILEANINDPKEFGLFLPSEEDNKKGIWLEASRSLDYYMLRNGDLLEYNKKTRNLRVRMLDDREYRHMAGINPKLDYYMLRNGDLLEYNKKTRNLRVRMLDGEFIQTESIGIWLDYYMLRNGDLLEYNKKTRNLRVRMLDGEFYSDRE
ncbi:hypothetical protein NE865_14510 [Phthorimaea operculella]|nr:hypothetical protein NE865_14510 [Phthorimaea operculella]